MDRAYVFAAVVIVGGILAIVLLARRISKQAPRLTPFSPDRNYWWDGVAWKPVLSDDGKWEWDGYRWQPRLPQVTTGSQKLAATLANTNPGAQFALQVLMTFGIMAVLISLGYAFGFKPSGGTISVSALAAIAGFTRDRFALLPQPQTVPCLSRAIPSR